MKEPSMRPLSQESTRPRGFDGGTLAIWALCFGLVALLGIEGGGFDPLVHDQVGIGIWWVLLVGVLVGALPRARQDRLALVALVALAAFAVWTALSLSWTESGERTSAELARVLTYLGCFTLMLSLRRPGDMQRIVEALAAAIGLIAILALLSRLHPEWFPAAADETARFLSESRERLSYPLQYWNGLGALVAIGLPLLLQVSAAARSFAVRGLAAAALPALALTLFFTLSRGGIAAALVALVVFIAFSEDRVPKALTLALSGAGAALLIALADQRQALREGLDTATAHSQGDELLLIGLAVCLAVGLLHAAASAILSEERRPSWTRPSREQSLVGVGAAAVVLVIAALAVDAPGRISDGIDEFRGGGNAGAGSERLNSFAGESRYDLWTSTIDQNATAPLTGTGAGTFVYWWDRDGAGAEAVQDAHSLYLQTLGEVGIVGLLLLLAFVAAVLAIGTMAAVRAGPLERSALAAGLAGCVAFFVSAAVDWSWQLPVLPIATLLLAAGLVGAGAAPAADRARRAPVADGAARVPVWLRLGAVPVALAAIAMIAIPLAATSLTRDSEAAARAGDLNGALADARSAQNVQPWAASPRLQEALVLELRGEVEAATEAAEAAAERESTNWRTWFVLARLQAQRGDVDAALEAYRRAEQLNPLSPLFRD